MKLYVLTWNIPKCDEEQRAYALSAETAEAHKKKLIDAARLLGMHIDEPAYRRQLYVDIVCESFIELQGVKPVDAKL